MMRLISTLIALSLALNVQAAGDPKMGSSKSQACVGCHGVGGNSTVPNFPKLAGQHANYTLKQLKDFKSKQRKDPVMEGQVANLSESDMADLGAYFATQKGTTGKTDKAKFELGERIFRGGIETKSVAACMGCHGPTGAGNPPANFPALAGQHAAYITKAMKDFRDNKRENDAGKMMRTIAGSMSDSEIEAVASYISGLH